MRYFLSPTSAGGGGASVSAKDAMDLLLLTQYCDMMAELREDVAATRWGGRHRECDVDDECKGNHGGTASTSLLLVHMPEAVSELTDTARECFGSATVTGDNCVKAINLIEL
jgi:hypothetical protein